MPSDLSTTDPKSSRGLAARLLRRIHAARILLRRRGLSLRTQLILLLGVLVLLATASLGSIAYRTSRTIVEQDAIRDVGVTATVRKQILVRMLNQQRIRADALLKTVDVGCSPDETWCLRKILVDFLATEGATAAELVYRGYKPALAGTGAAELAAEEASSAQTVRFKFDPAGQPFYILRVTSQDQKAVLTIRGDMKVSNQIFLDRDGLGQSGETFLVDEKGYFLTPPRYPRPGMQTGPINGAALRACLAGKDGEILAEGYRGVPVIHGFRFVPEVGGACVMTLIDQAEAFAPTRRIAREVAGVSGALGALAIAYSLMLAQLVSRPMKRLTRRARSLQQGDFDSPFPVEGPMEVRMFAQTFEGMAHSLKESRAALEESSERMKNILQGISDGFIAFDRQWRCTYVNDKATELSRIPREDLLGKNAWYLFPKLRRTKVYDELCRAMTKAVPIHFEEYCPPLDLWFEVDAYPTRDGLAIFGRDVTERRRVTERLQRTQKLESLGVLAGGIAHDFNNLLTGIMGNASMALDELPADTSVRGNLEAVVNASERAAALTRQLLAYAGKGRFVIERIDLSKLVRDISELLRTSIPRTIQLQLDLAEEMPCIEGDAAQIQQLVMNLVINAAEATAEHETGTVRIRTAVEEVNSVSIDQMIAPNGISAGKYVALEVRDAGCGMDALTLSRIFDPFFTTKFTGRGLGLAAVMGIVGGHKGALRVDSISGQGSSFKALFPACEGQPAKVHAASPQSQFAGHGTILVVDDEDAVRQTAKSALQSYGYRVVLAQNGEEGVNLFRELRDEISVVLLDMTMPVMSGEEAFTRIKHIREDIRVVLSSGYDETEATRRFTGKGLAGFVQKPYTAAGLAAKMKRALEVT